jgi:hypothetical protein
MPTRSWSPCFNCFTYQQTQAGCNLPFLSLSISFHCVLAIEQSFLSKDDIKVGASVQIFILPGPNI